MYVQLYVYMYVDMDRDIYIYIYLHTSYKPHTLPETRRSPNPQNPEPETL